MLYALYKFRHYLLGSHFNVYRPFSTKILSEQNSVGGENMHMVVVVLGI
jgi:hypothetical protein